MDQAKAIMYIRKYKDAKISALPEALQGDFKVLAELFRFNPYELQKASKEARNNNTVVESAILAQDCPRHLYSYEVAPGKEEMAYTTNGARALEFASDRLKSHTVFVKKALEKDAGVFEFLSEELRSDPQIAAYAIKNCPHCLAKFVGKDLLKNEEIAVMLIKKHGWAIYYLDESFKKRRHFATIAMAQDVENIQYLDTSLRLDREFLKKFVDGKGITLSASIDSLSIDQICKEIFIHQPNALLLFKEYIHNREFLLEVAHKNPQTFDVLDDEVLQKLAKKPPNRTFIEQMMIHRPEIIPFIDPKWQQDWQIVFMARRANPEVEKYLSETGKGVLSAAMTKWAIWQAEYAHSKLPGGALAGKLYPGNSVPGLGEEADARIAQIEAELATLIEYEEEIYRRS